MNPSEIAKRLRQATTERIALPAFTTVLPDFSIPAAYEAQQAGLELALSEGDIVCGYKMGLTSRAKQRDVNVFEPIRGYLLSSMEVAKGDEVTTASRLHPRVEPEVAIVLKTRLAGKYVTLRDVRQALALVVPALEILDSRYQDFSFKLPDVIADNTSASGFMLGSHDYLPRVDELCLMGITVKLNGQIVETGAPAAVLGDPLLSVVELAKSLAKENKAIEPGMVVLTGGITTSVPFKAGDVVEIVWPTETLSFRAV